MSNNDESSNNNNNDATSSSFPSLKTLETEHSIIIDNNAYDNGSNNNTDDGGRSINDHIKHYFIREAKCVGMIRSFKHLFLVLRLRKPSYDIEL